MTTISLHPDQTSNDQRFVDYYATASATVAARRRFGALRDTALRFSRVTRPLAVADIGCNTATSNAVWAELGHHVYGLDISTELLRIARQRLRDAGLPAHLCLGSATALPWTSGTMDVCMVIELLEHIGDWQSCLDECARVLRPGGILLLSTTNRLCPRQSEFNLPLYSWYPRRVKRRFERLARTTRPQLANFATHPAINWFSFYSLRRELASRGLRALDRFDVIDLAGKSRARRMLAKAIRRLSLVRYLAHVFTPATFVLAVKPVPAKMT